MEDISSTFRLEVISSFLFSTDKDGDRFFRNADINLPNHTASLFRKQ